MLGASGTRRAAALAALLAAGAASAAPLVVNGGFERTDAAGAVVGWRPDGKAWTFDEEGGVDGSRALRWANGDPAYYAMPSQCPSLAAGRRYRLSVKVRCERLVGGKAGACLAVRRRNARRGREHDACAAAGGGSGRGRAVCRGFAADRGVAEDCP